MRPLRPPHGRHRGIHRFGEAGQAFAADPEWRGRACGYDRLTDRATRRADKLGDFVRCGVEPRDTVAEAVNGARIVLSLVTADQALAAAEAAAPHLAPGALFCDMNSVAPMTKRAAAARIEAAGASYVDVAVMAPAHPARLAVPLLSSGDHGEDATAMLRAIGFSAARAMAGPVGRASSVKMVRSVMIKGIEALTAEMLAAADAADVRDAVLASLGDGWDKRAAYNLERMQTHGLRRAAEMEEVARTLDALDVEPTMTRGTIAWQRRIGGGMPVAQRQERAA